MPYLVALVLLLLTSCASQPQPENSAYVHPKTCEGCHQQIALSYRQTGMARAFHKITPDEVPTSGYTHPKSAFTYQFSSREGKVYLKRTEGNNENPFEKEIHYVLGSGNHARSFLHRTPEGRLLEMPVNWYPENGGTVAMSPGYDRPDHTDMRRAIGYQCAFCHNGYSNAKGNSLLDDPVFTGEMNEGIDCQRCHGPGREHASTGGRGKILNPKKLSPARQMEVCMQCHLETTSFSLPNSIVKFDQPIFGYDPSKPLASFIQHFDHAKGSTHDDKFEIASSAYRLRQSRCFIASNEKMTCTTCHNPHEKTKSVDAACQSCHPNIVSSAKHPAKADCASCHMPRRRTEDVIHVAVTDHKIQRPNPKLNPMAAREEHHETMGKDSWQGEVVPYYPAAPENDLYPAVAQVVHLSNLSKGIPRLEAALAQHQPTHPAFYTNLALAYHSAGQPQKAIPHYNKALSLDAKFLPALRSLGATQLQMNQLAEAKATLEKATQLHAGDSLSWLELGRVHRAQGNSQAGIEAARKAIALEPELVEAHKLLGNLLTGSAAEAAFRQAVQLHPREAESRTSLGNLLVARGATADAEGHYRAAIAAAPGLKLPYFNLALLYANGQRFAEALPMAQKAVELDPKSLESLDLLANLHMATRNFRAAATTYRQALAVNSSFPRALLGLGTASGAMNDFASARNYLTQAANSSDPAVKGEAAALLQSLPR